MFNYINTTKGGEAELQQKSVGALLASQREMGAANSPWVEDSPEKEKELMRETEASH